MQSIPKAHEIINHISSKNYKPSSSSQLRAYYKITKKAKKAFKKLLHSLVERGELQVDHRKIYTIASKNGRSKRGEITENKSQSRGKPRENRRDRDRDNRKQKALITEGLTKAVIKRDGRIWKVYPFDKNIEPQVVRFKDVRQAKEGALVFYSLEEEGGKDYAKIEVQVERVTDFSQIANTFLNNAGLPPDFPVEVQAEIKKIRNVTKVSARSREDYTSKHTVCIDPIGARDHDDAISLEKTSTGWELGVHIADVSHYVKEDTFLDEEAKERSFTQYLPWMAVPMLPEKLSSNLCSLRQGEDRLAFSCIVTLSPRGIIKDFRFAKTVINVDESISYEDAQERLSQKNDAIANLSKVTRYLKARRLKSGIMELSLPESKVLFDDDLNPIDFTYKEYLESQSWIEECMLLANQCCAKFMIQNDLPGIYRTHESPAWEDFEELLEAEPLLTKGLRFNMGSLKNDWEGENNVNKKVFSVYQHMVEQAKTKDNPILMYKILRSMKKARYEAFPNGHFALNWSDYLHFTSPIRRYADLWVHRQMSKFLTGTRITDTEDEAIEISNKISDKEITIQKNERTAKKVCMSWIFQDFVGDTFEGIINGVEEFGLFVELKNYPAEGLVRFQDIPGDYYVCYKEKGYVEGRKSKRRFVMGDPVFVEVLKVNPTRGEIDFKILMDKDKREED